MPDRPITKDDVKELESDIRKASAAVAAGYADLLSRLAAETSRRERAEGELKAELIDDMGTVWTRPTVWAYMKACRALEQTTNRMEKAEAERDELAAHIAELRGALERAYEGASRQLAEPRDHADDQYALTAIATICEAAVAATPQQSLARIKAEALREAASRCTAIDGGTPFIYQDQLEAEADRLAKESSAK